VKLRLPGRQAYDQVAAMLAAGKQATYAQENFFFDGDKQELESQRAVLRLRFFNGDEKAVITVKGKQLLVGGIGRATEVEEDVPKGGEAAARGWLSHPNELLTASPLLQDLNKNWGIQNLLCMGGFRNHRTVFAWEGETLELDETSYEHGTLYEIEVETTQPEVVRDRLEVLLKGAGVDYSYSATSKFANFINKSLL